MGKSLGARFFMAHCVHSTLPRSTSNIELYIIYINLEHVCDYERDTVYDYESYA